MRIVAPALLRASESSVINALLFLDGCVVPLH